MRNSQQAYIDYTNLNQRKIIIIIIINVRRTVNVNHINIIVDRNQPPIMEPKNKV